MPEKLTISDRHKVATDKSSEMQQAPADGEMAIQWQKTGKGYYGHLHRLESFGGKGERSEYWERLLVTSTSGWQRIRKTTWCAM